jgi:hypothetical protein
MSSLSFAQNENPLFIPSIGCLSKKALQVFFFTLLGLGLSFVPLGILLFC